MPTAYPKCSPTELPGLLVLLRPTTGREDVARLADDLDLEIDEILPSTEFAEALRLIEGQRRTRDPHGGRHGVVNGASIRERKAILREQLDEDDPLQDPRSRALESKPDHRLSEDEVNDLVEFTTAPADEFVQNIINWGRFTELFRYDADQHAPAPGPRPQRPRHALRGPAADRPGGTRGGGPRRDGPRPTPSPPGRDLARSVRVANRPPE